MSYNEFFLYFRGGGRSRKNFEASTDDAQKKFGGAKSISSDQFFGNNKVEDLCLIPLIYMS